MYALKWVIYVIFHNFQLDNKVPKGLSKLERSFKINNFWNAVKKPWEKLKIPMTSDLWNPGWYWQSSICRRNVAPSLFVLYRISKE